MPPVDALTLSHRSIFIFPSKEGWSYAAVIALCFIGAVNYQNSLGHVLAFLLIALGHLGIHYTYRNLAGLRLRLGHAQPVFVGEEAQFPVVLESLSGREHAALAIGFSARDCVYTDVEPATEAVVRIGAPARRRGWFRPSRVYVASQYPLGILRAWTWIAFSGACLVYPKPIAPPELPAGAGDDARSRKAHSRAGSEDYVGVRRFVPGDSPRQVDWKALARERGLYSKQFAESAGSLQVLDFEAFSGVERELRLSYLSFLVLKSEREEQSYALKLPGLVIPAGRGPQQRERCLKALALFGDEA